MPPCILLPTRQAYTYMIHIVDFTCGILTFFILHMFILFKLRHSCRLTYNAHTTVYAPFTQLKWELPAIVVGSLITVQAWLIVDVVAILETYRANHFIGVSRKIDQHQWCGRR
jgi:hypothetical protein